jgi:hypothetical protein
MADRQATGGAPEVFHNPRIIVGIIFEPTHLSAQPSSLTESSAE